MSSQMIKQKAFGTVAVTLGVVLVIGTGIYRYVSTRRRSVETNPVKQTASGPAATTATTKAIPDPALTAEECRNRMKAIGFLLESFYIENNRYPTTAEYNTMTKGNPKSGCPADNSRYEYIPDAIRTETDGQISFLVPAPGQEDPVGKFAIQCGVHSAASGIQVFCTESAVGIIRK